jgi:hypothetical protein
MEKRKELSDCEADWLLEHISVLFGIGGIDAGIIIGFSNLAPPSKHSKKHIKIGLREFNP